MRLGLNERRAGNLNLFRCNLYGDLPAPGMDHHVDLPLVHTNGGPAMKRYADDMTVETTIGVGTTVTMTIKL